MANIERARDRGTRRGGRLLATLADEFREARYQSGVSQRFVAGRSGVSRSTYSRIENARHASLSIQDAARVASTLGLDLVVRAYPGTGSLRDGAHAERLGRLLSFAAQPLSVAREVPLPARPGSIEQRAWDAVVTGSGARTALELEMRLRDAQALERRLALKRRDDPVERFVLAIADSRSNRRALLEARDLFASLPRLSRRSVIESLQAGRHPPSGIVLV
jgi:transcriptional regulator with XRE-family HTH domain